MAFKRFTKAEWFALSKEDQDYHTLEFKKEEVIMQRRTILATRAIAIFLIFGLFWIGFIQYFSILKHSNIIDQYGPAGYCYLCGLENLRSCSCVYPVDSSGKVIHNQTEIDKMALKTAQDNIAQCPIRAASVDTGNLPDNTFISLDKINLTK